MKNIKACVFNAYGALLDNYQPLDKYQDKLGENALIIYKLWRAKRLQYSSQLSLMNQHISYDKIRRYALEFACDVYGVTDENLITNILEEHTKLECYADVKEPLTYLKNKGIMTTVLSNGAPQSLASTLKHAEINHLLNRIISTEQIHSLKPSPAVYEYVAEQLGLSQNKICFISSNSWDIAGAVACGFKTIWINRNNRKPERLPFKADIQIDSLASLSDHIS